MPLIFSYPISFLFCVPQEGTVNYVWVWAGGGEEGGFGFSSGGGVGRKERNGSSPFLASREKKRAERKKGCEGARAT